MQSNDVNAAAGCNAPDARPGMVGLSVDAVRRHRARDRSLHARERQRSSLSGQPMLVNRGK